MSAMSQISISNLSFIYNGSFDYVFENVSFLMDTDWKLGFTGRNGSGKTTFLSLLLGKFEYTGRISTAVHFEYFPYEVKDACKVTKDIVNEICPSYQDWELTRELSLLELSDDVLLRPFCTLSNGEQTKVLLAALFLNENHFLLIDEPTNHLDVHGREIVSDYLNNKRGFILVSHDRAFVDGCVDHILCINRTNIEIQKGNFSSWFANKKLQDEFELEENAKLKKEIKRLEKTAREKADWANKIEDTKKGAKALGGSNGGLGMVDRGYIGAKSARMMKKSKNIEQRSQKAVEEKS
jgi:lincosamide and streptogramin A transport system ATP-binding/permease protein